MEFLDICKKRYAVKLFDKRRIAQEKIDVLLEMIQLAPTSFGIQPFHVRIVTDQKTKDALLPASWNQQQIPTASHVLVFCANVDIQSHINKYTAVMRSQNTEEEQITGYKSMLEEWLEKLPEQAKLPWAQRQVYIALGNAMNGATALGFDSCPMEGFQPDAYAKILGLPHNLVPTVVLPIGYAADSPKPKTRLTKDDLFSTQ